MRQYSILACGAIHRTQAGTAAHEIVCTQELLKQAQHSNSPSAERAYHAMCGSSRDVGHDGSDIRVDACTDFVLGGELLAHKPSCLPDIKVNHQRSKVMGGLYVRFALVSIELGMTVHHSA